MKVLSNLEFKNSTYILNKFEDFPENPSEGTVIFKENGLYIYSTNVTSGNLEWINILDFTRTNTSFKFEQNTESIEWNITHNLNTQDLFVIVYDSEGNKQVESEIQFQSDNEIKLIFSEPISGKALLFGASVMSSPSNVYTKEEIDELLKNISGGDSNIILPENGTDGQVLVKDSSTESGLNWSDKIDGKSAFDIAKEDGFEGTEEEWLKSLKGINGYSMIGVNYSNPITLESKVISGENYPTAECTVPQSGFIVCNTIPTSVASPGQSINNVSVNGTVLFSIGLRTGNNRVAFFVNKDDIVRANANGSNVTFTFTLFPGITNTYTTEETIIGTWIDNRPIYRKTFQIIGPSSINSWENVMDISDLNIDQAINIYGISVIPTGANISINSTGTNNATFINAMIGNDRKSISIISNASGTLNSNNTITLEYIKTTD